MARDIIKINEDTIRNAVRKAINEISYGKVDDAYYKSNPFDSLSMKFDEFYEELTDAEAGLMGNKTFAKVAMLADQIKKILDRKSAQNTNFLHTTAGVDYGAYFNDPKNGDREINQEELPYLRQNYGRG